MKIVSKKQLDCSFPRYDISVADNHNFVSAGAVVHNCNARYVFADGEMHCGSRTEWKREYPSYSHITIDYLLRNGMEQEKAQEVFERIHNKPRQRNLWWDIIEKTPSLRQLCEANPGLVVYGEVYGNINCIKYGLPDVNRFAAFDMLKDGRWLDFEEAYDLAHRFGVPWVPLLHEVPGQFGWKYDFDLVCSLAEGPTLVPGAGKGVIREGVVVRPWEERWDDRLGRVSLKCVSGAYLEKYR